MDHKSTEPNIVVKFGNFNKFSGLNQYILSRDVMILFDVWRNMEWFEIEGEEKVKH